MTDVTEAMDNLRRWHGHAGDSEARAVRAVLDEVDRLRGIMRGFADSDPWRVKPPPGGLRCSYCSARRASFAPWSVEGHDPECVWRQAVDAVWVTS